MKKSIVVVARNEKEWPLKTCLDFLDNIPEAEIIGIDDGGDNEWPEEGVKVYKTSGGIGVGHSRLMGVNKASGDLIMLSDAHVYYYEGNVDKAWRLANKGYIVNPSVKVMYKEKIRCGMKFELGKYKVQYVKAKTGDRVGLIGSVYFMKKEIAQRVVAPTQAHGYNEFIMTLAANVLGHKIYALPDLIFEHMYKKKLDYAVSGLAQARNKDILNAIFFKYKMPQDATPEEIAYKKMIEKESTLNGLELNKLINNQNAKLIEA